MTFTLNATTDEHDYDKCAGIIIKRKIGSGSYAESDLVGSSSDSRWRTSFTVKGLAFNDGHNGMPYTISGIDAPSHSGSTVTYQVHIWFRIVGVRYIVMGLLTIAIQQGHSMQDINLS